MNDPTASPTPSDPTTTPDPRTIAVVAPAQDPQALIFPEGVQERLRDFAALFRIQVEGVDVEWLGDVADQLDHLASTMIATPEDRIALQDAVNITYARFLGAAKARDDAEALLIANQLELAQAIADLNAERALRQRWEDGFHALDHANSYDAERYRFMVAGGYLGVRVKPGEAPVTGKDAVDLWVDQQIMQERMRIDALAAQAEREAATEPKKEHPDG